MGSLKLKTYPFLFCIVFLKLAVAQSCWRNLTCDGPTDTAFPGIWESNIFAPKSRKVNPKQILSAATGEVMSNYSSTTYLVGNGSQVVFDFGKEVGGLVSLNYTTTGSGAIGLAFTEGKNWIGEWSDSSNGEFKGPDGAIYANLTSAGSGTYTMPDRKLRGGFRYLTTFLTTSGNATVQITGVDLNIAFQPTWSNLQAYQGYFHSNDELLNRIWYSGAYTLQTNAVPIDTGRQVPFVIDGWANNGTLGNGTTIIVDGAKRDRAVWPGDMGVAVPSTFVSIGDLTSVRNALQAMYDHQNADGSFPEAGPPLLQQSSDTYHMWTMVGTYNYLLYTNDTTFLAHNWAGYQRAMVYIYDKVLSPGLLNVTGTRDWARWATGGNGSEPNMILYHTLITGASLATWASDSTNISSTWLSRAATLKSTINAYLWDSSCIPDGCFKDNATSTSLHPQDANSMSILFSAVNSSTRTQAISSQLLSNWGTLGAISPELPNNISPFISSFEIQAHFLAAQAQRALDLIRRSWGWYINNPNGTESTVIEGYLFNGSFGYRNSRGYDYDESYVSHSHGWSSGPTSALTEFVLGLSVTAPVGTEWKLAPQFGDLMSVEGGFTTSLGKFRAGWKVFGGNRTAGYVLEYSVPEGTSGEVVLPVLEEGMVPAVRMDGVAIKETLSVNELNGVSLRVGGGSHKFVVG